MKARRDPRLISGDKTGVYICLGQSLSANSVEGTVTAANANKIDCLNVYDGGLYEGTEGLLGCSSLDNDPVTNGNLFVRVADKLIAADTNRRVILIPLGINGMSVGLWATQSEMRERLKVAFLRAQALGLTVNGCLWQQGEADTYNGTTQAAYTSALQSLIAYPRSLGFNAPWLIARASYYQGATSAAVIAGQNGTINGTTILAGPNTDVIGSGGRRDNAHFNFSGADTASTLWVSAIQAAGLSTN